MSTNNNILILGTPFLYQHQVMLGFNDSCVVIGSDKALPMKGENIRKLSLRSMEVSETELEEA
jgi:hypothetical protein